MILFRVTRFLRKIQALLLNTQGYVDSQKSNIFLFIYELYGIIIDNRK